MGTTESFGENTPAEVLGLKWSWTKETCRSERTSKKKNNCTTTDGKTTLFFADSTQTVTHAIKPTQEPPPQTFVACASSCFLFSVCRAQVFAIQTVFTVAWVIGRREGAATRKTWITNKSVAGSGPFVLRWTRTWLADCVVSPCMVGVCF